MRPRASIYSSGSRSVLGSSPTSKSNSLSSNKYTDTPRERLHKRLHLKESDSLCLESSLASGPNPKNWFNIGPISGEYSSKTGMLGSDVKKSQREASLLHHCEDKPEFCPAVQLIKLTFKDRPPGSSKRVSAGSQDRQTATRDESSRLAEQKDLTKQTRDYNKTLKTTQTKDNAPLFSFLTHSESALDKSSIISQEFIPSKA